MKLNFSEGVKLPRGKTRQRKMLFYPSGIADGCTQFRFEFVRNSLNSEKKAEIQITNIFQEFFIKDGNRNILNPAYSDCDAVVLQRPVQEKFVSITRSLNVLQNNIRSKGVRPFRFVIDVDDIINNEHIADYNVAKAGYRDGKRFDVFRKSVDMCDELHVASKEMQKYYSNILDTDKVTYRPNFLPKYLYEGFYNEDSYKRYEKHSKRPRIVWAGSWSHFDVENRNKGIDDFSELINFIKKTKNKYKWVFYGAHPPKLKSGIDNGDFEYYKWSSILSYPRKLWDLEPVIFIAPIQDNIFNRCKSNIKLTEMGVMGIAGVYQDLPPYQEAPLKFNNIDEFEDRVNYLLSGWDNYLGVIRAQRSFGEKFFMEDNMDFLLSTYLYSINDKMRDEYKFLI